MTTESRGSSHAFREQTSLARAPRSATTVDPSVVAEGFASIQRNVEKVFEGDSETTTLALVALLAEGHLLIEDVPGVGKTLLAKAIARSISCSVRRVQFTPDLLPSDITGVTVYSQQRDDFEFKPGAVFANLVLGDEINRAGPKTQSALLEAMQERTVTVDGVTYELAVPFMVIATQNPIELEGTYPLPEAQRDRFLMQVSIGYPSVDKELAVLDEHSRGDRVGELASVTDAQAVAQLIAACTAVHAADGVRRYIVDFVRATREHRDISLGASPRASVGLLRASRALAAALGRNYVTADDIKRLARPVLAHRMIVSAEAQLRGRSTADVIEELLHSVPIPTT
ncbi:MAG TPA: AAA family ATPase [Euzebyales bacterium]|nr:AAA family ATPase [Euzebyales bacterium]